MSDEPDVHELAKRLAMVLGSGWTYETPKVQDGDRSPRYASLRHTEGYGMHLAPIWNKPDRLEISGTWPKNFKGMVQVPHIPYGTPVKEQRPEITVATARGGEAIAAEIQKRFLPLYVSKWQEMAKEAKRQDDHEAGQLALIEKLAALTGEKLSDHNRERKTFTWKSGGWYSDIEVYSPTDATLKLRVNAEQAERILKMLKAVA